MTAVVTLCPTGCVGAAWIIGFCLSKTLDGHWQVLTARLSAGAASPSAQEGLDGVGSMTGGELVARSHL